jgi:hypothetical protein
LSTKGQIPATKELGKLHFRTAALDLIYKKSAERERRTKVTAHTKVFQVIEGRNIPDWKKFLSVKENKQALINSSGDFIVKFNQSNPLVPNWKSVLQTLSFSRLNGIFSEFFRSYRSNTSATVCAFAKHAVNCLQ